MKTNMIQKLALLIAATALLFPSPGIKAAETMMHAAAAANHTLVLTVTDFDTGRPIRGARVTGYWDDGHKHTGPIPSAVTGSDGVARITYAAATYWRITVTMTGYKTIETTRVATEPNRPDNLSLRMHR